MMGMGFLQVGCGERTTGGGWGQSGEEGSGSFLKKRTKKLLSIGTCAPRGSRMPTDKVFLLLFVHKKKTLTSL
jgi:hypothetical protein